MIVKVESPSLGKGKKRIRVEVPRLDAIIRWASGPVELLFVRTGQLDYRELGPEEVSKLYLWLRGSGVEDWRELSLAEVDEAIR